MSSGDKIRASISIIRAFLGRNHRPSKSTLPPSNQKGVEPPVMSIPNRKRTSFKKISPPKKSSKSEHSLACEASAEINLTAMEERLLFYLARNSGCVLTPDT